jgi:hypothetical protein
MQTQQTTPLAPYGSMNHLALVAKVGVGGKTPPPQATRTVVRRAAAQ